MARPSTYPTELRERAVRLVIEVRADHPSEAAAIRSLTLSRRAASAIDNSPASTLSTIRVFRSAGIAGGLPMFRLSFKTYITALPQGLTRDNGSQFRSRKMAHALNRHAMVGSMGRVGAARDNAAMESFWSLLQTNVLNQRRWATRQQLRLAIVLWIERKYHRQRPQDSLCGLTPIEYENKITIKAAPAA